MPHAAAQQEHEVVGRAGEGKGEGDLWTAGDALRLPSPHRAAPVAALWHAPAHLAPASLLGTGEAGGGGDVCASAGAGAGWAPAAARAGGGGAAPAGCVAGASRQHPGGEAAALVALHGQAGGGQFGRAGSGQQRGNLALA